MQITMVVVEEGEIAAAEKNENECAGEERLVSKNKEIALKMW